MIEQLASHPIIAPLVVAFITGVVGWFVLLKQLEVKVNNLKDNVQTRFAEMDKRVVLLEESIKENKDIQNRILIQLHVLEAKFDSNYKTHEP